MEDEEVKELSGKQFTAANKYGHDVSFQFTVMENDPDRKYIPAILAKQIVTPKDHPQIDILRETLRVIEENDTHVIFEGMVAGSVQQWLVILQMIISVFTEKGIIIDTPDGIMVKNEFLNLK